MWFLNWRFLIAAAMVLSTCAVGWTSYAAGKQRGMEHVQLQWDSEKLQLIAEATSREQYLKQKLEKANAASRLREKQLRADAAGSLDTALRLHNQLTEASSRIPTASCTTTREYASTVTELFGNCKTAYRNLAEKADGHANDAVTLREAWPTNQPSQKE